MQAKVLLVGAGRSSSALIRFLADKVNQSGWRVTVSDASATLLDRQLQAYQQLNGEVLDWHPEKMPVRLLMDFDVVISLLPAELHVPLAKICLVQGKHMITASYTSRDMWALDKAAQQAGVLLLNEMGFDPGIDHMSAMQRIDQIRAQGGRINAFYSHAGGLVAPACDNNPWRYKFTWNPRNVVLAGQGKPAVYLEKGEQKLVAYHQLFRRVRPVQTTSYGSFESYPNRDSLSYLQLYGLQEVETLLRGTLRREGFCAAWNCLVQLGLTNNEYVLHTDGLTWRKLTNMFLPYDAKRSVEEKLAYALGIEPDGEEMQKLHWLGLFEDKPIEAPDRQMTPAALLQFLLEEKWALESDDRDMVVLQHEIEYEQGGKSHYERCELILEGDSPQLTAMAKAVGLPLGVAAELILEKGVQLCGVHIPTHRLIYEPVLERLANMGIHIHHQTM